jgi:hypothetical protein
MIGITVDIPVLLQGESVQGMVNEKPIDDAPSTLRGITQDVARAEHVRVPWWIDWKAFGRLVQEQLPHVAVESLRTIVGVHTTGAGQVERSLGGRAQAEPQEERLAEATATPGDVAPRRWGAWSVTALGTAGIAASLLYFFFAGDPAVVLKAFMPVMLEAWGLIGVTALAARFKGRYAIQASVLAAGTAATFWIFHVVANSSPTLGGWGMVSVNVAMRLVSVFAGVLLAKWLFARSMPPSQSFRRDVATAFRWALAQGLVNGYFVYSVFIPFIGAHLINDVSKIAFQISLGTMATVTPLGIMLGSVVGEEQTLSFSARLRKTLRTLPLVFVFGTPVVATLWIVRDLSGSLLIGELAHATLNALFMAVLSNAVANFTPLEPSPAGAGGSPGPLPLPDAPPAAASAVPDGLVGGTGHADEAAESLRAVDGAV